jgi:hypothetical protein
MQPVFGGLVCVADEDRLGTGLAQVVRPDHDGFVDDDQSLRAELQLLIAQ